MILRYLMLLTSSKEKIFKKLSRFLKTEKILLTCYKKCSSIIQIKELLLSRHSTTHILTMFEANSLREKSELDKIHSIFMMLYSYLFFLIDSFNIIFLSNKFINFFFLKFY
jgi:hypothetical protein